MWHRNNDICPGNEHGLWVGVGKEEEPTDSALICH